MTMSKLIEELEKFLSESHLNPDCSLLNKIRETLDTARLYKSAGVQ